MNFDLEAIVQQQVDGLGYDLVEFRRGGTRNRPLLDVRIDRRDGARVSVDDCAFVSRSLQRKLDDSDIAGSEYVLEVSSPGVERPLRTTADWRRFAGRRVRAKLRAIDDSALQAPESREFEIVEVLGDGENAIAVLNDRKQQLHRVRLADVIEARLVFVWK